MCTSTSPLPEVGPRSARFMILHDIAWNYCVDRAEKPILRRPVQPSCFADPRGRGRFRQSGTETSRPRTHTNSISPSSSCCVQRSSARRRQYNRALPVFCPKCLSGAALIIPSSTRSFFLWSSKIERCAAFCKKEDAERIILLVVYKQFCFTKRCARKNCAIIHFS